MRVLLMAVAVLATGCTRVAAPAGDNAAETARIGSTPTPAATPARNYVGRWTGVEGMFLDVHAGAQPGRFGLTMQYDLDHRDTVVAKLQDDTLMFTRNGKAMTLRPTDGAATGLKYLAGKKDCLTVASGEGYCRD